jgi:apolipoprotein N-acyltransferase
MQVRQAYGLATVSGVLYFLAFAGFDLWPVAFVALLPVLWVAERADLSTRQAIGVGLWFGFVTNWGGYYWLVEMLERFSGFPWAACVLFASLVCLLQGGQLAVFFLATRAIARNGSGIAWIAAPIYAATEFAYPLLFPSYFANCFHDLPWMIQVVDLGGPTLLSALAVLWNGALYHLVISLRDRIRFDRRVLASGLASLIATVGYGGYRVAEVTARSEAAAQLDIGVVQADMGIFAKRSDPREGHRRHVEQSLALERDARVDLIVWPESAIVWPISTEATQLSGLLDPLRTPILFGGLARGSNGEQRRIYNRAFLTDAAHNVVGTYDKTYLLAFGEYLPLGERFPQLYTWSPHSGRFTPGDHQRALPLGDLRIATLICYEDVLPAFTRNAVRTNDPHLLVNITNDSWFGDTHEPWIHLALAKFRAVEHHRALVRATNSGVSAIIDAAGRVVAHSGTFERTSLHAQVPLLTGQTVYGLVGDWPGWVSFAFCLWSLLQARRKAHPRDTA